MSYVKRTSKYLPTWIQNMEIYNSRAKNPYAYPGNEMPNCTTYAFGRWYEITGQRPRIPVHQASHWYEHTEDGYARSQTPSLGDIICFSGGSDGAGHVGIVEEINYDSQGRVRTINTSNSAYVSTDRTPENPKYFYMKLLEAENHYYMGAGYTFLGFIKCPFYKFPLIYYTRRY